MPTLELPTAGGGIAPYTTGAPRDFAAPKRTFNRLALAAAHVVADPLADVDPWLAPAVDWDARGSRTASSDSESSGAKIYAIDEAPSQDATDTVF